MRTASSAQDLGQIGPADLTLPPTQPIDITVLVAQQLAAQLAPTSG